MKDLILASASPRRKEILSKAGLIFEIIPSKYDEKLDSKIFSYKKIETLALNKALEVNNRVTKSALIISADTVVILDNTILTKPKDYNDAFNMLKALSDRIHHVVTSICIIDSDTEKQIVKSVTTKVEFNPLSSKMISDYIINFKPYDKAGAYGIQELPSDFVKNVDGSFENVIGISSKAVKELIQQA